MTQLSLFDDDTGVSPVIGVVLMVAITVLLAATAATLFLDFQNEGTESTPTATFEFDYDASGSSDALDVTHESGETLEAGALEIVIDGAAPGDVNGRYAFEDFPDFGATSEITAGTGVKLDKSASSLDASGNVDLSGATVRVVWTAGSDDSGTVINEWTAE